MVKLNPNRNKKYSTLKRTACVRFVVALVCCYAVASSTAPEINI